MRPWRSAVAAAVVLAGLPACVSLKRTPEARFFVLRSLVEPPSGAPSSAAADLLGVLPVLVPGYLDRPQVVTWAAPGELRIDEFLRWAEPLDAGVSRTLAENLDALLPEHRVIRSPWPSATKLRCRIRVELEQFGPQASGEVLLVGGFALLPAREERPLVAHAVSLRRGPLPRHTSGPDAGLGVDTMSELLADLAREITAALRALPKDND